MTGGWELALSKIATGEMDAPTFHRGLEVFASQIAKELLEARIDGAESDTACPRCGRPVVFYPKLRFHDNGTGDGKLKSSPS